MSIKYKVINPLTKEGYYYDDTTDKMFQRIIAGVSWPGERPGFIAVIGEEVAEQPPYGEHGRKQPDVYLIAECEEESTGELIKRCLELKQKCKVSTFYGYSKYDQNMHFLALLNKRGREENRKQLSIQTAPFSDDDFISYHINVLLERLSVNNKSLHLTENSKLPGYLQELQGGDVHNAKAKDFPAVAALGFAVSALTVYEYKQNNPMALNNDEQNNIYDPFDNIRD